MEVLKSLNGMKESIWYFAVVQHISKLLDIESEIFIIINSPKVSTALAHIKDSFH